MSKTAQTIHIEPDSDLARALEAPATASVVVDTGEARYTLLVTQAEPTRDVFAGYDPQAALAGLRALDEALVGVDREDLLRELRAQRAQDSAGRPARRCPI